MLLKLFFNKVMSLEHIKSFYEKLANYTAFRMEIQNATNKEECTQIVKAAGYDFTEDEFKYFTNQLLDFSESEMRDLDQQELAYVLGGQYRTIVPPYGTVWPKSID